MWEFDYKESWALNNWCFWIVMEKAFESPLDCKEIKPANPKGNQHWILIGRTDAEAEAPKLWPPEVKSWLIGTDPDSGKDQEGQKGNRGWDGWMDPSLTQWTWTWANSKRWWGTGRPGMLQLMGLQRIGHNLTTEKQRQYNYWKNLYEPPLGNWCLCLLIHNIVLFYLSFQKASVF